MSGSTGKLFGIDTTVNLGTILTSLTLVGGIMLFAVTKSSVADQSVVSIAAFRTEAAAQFAEVKAQIAGLPDQRAAVIQIERRLLEISAADLARDIRVSKMDQELYKATADIATLTRGAATPSPRR